MVDHSGVVKLYSRMDGAVLGCGCVVPSAPAIAPDAHWQAVADTIKDDPILSGGAPALEDFILLGGGSPIYVDGALVGAIGVAGGHYSKDEACVTAALAALEQME